MMDSPTSAPPTTADSTDTTLSAPSITHRSELTLLRCRVATLEAMLAAERQRRQAIVDRYERLLEEE